MMGQRPGQVELGSRIEVYWDGDDTWYMAEVTEFDPLTEWCKVLYDDGEKEEFRLSDVEYKKICGDKMREKDMADDPGDFLRKRLRYIHHTLLDMADRLPEYAVRNDSRRWWEEWQDSVQKAADSPNVPTLVKLAAIFGEQISVSDIEGKVDVTTAWWKTQREDWQTKLKEATNYEDVYNRVQDLLLRAVDWTAARNLFTALGDTDFNTDDTASQSTGEDTMNEELKRKESVLETIIPALADRGFLRVDADVVCERLPAVKRRKLVKKTMGEVTHGIDKEVSFEGLSDWGWDLSKIVKKQKVGDTAEAKAVDVQVQEDFGMSQRTFWEELKEIQVPVTQSDMLGRETRFFGTLPGGKKKPGRRKRKEKKLQDAGKLNAGNLCNTFVFTEAHVIKKGKRGQKKKIQPFTSMADVLPSVDMGTTGKADVSPVLKDHSEFIKSRSSQEGIHLLSNGSLATNPKEDLKGTTSAVKLSQEGALLSNAAVPGTNLKEGVPKVTAPETQFEVRRKRGRPRKVMLALDQVGLTVKVSNQVDFYQGSRQMSVRTAEEQGKQQEGQVKSQVDKNVDLTVRVISEKSEMVPVGLEKEKQHRKRGRPRKVTLRPVMESQSKRMMDISSLTVGRTTQWKDVLVEDGEMVKPRKRGRPRKSVIQETCTDTFRTSCPPPHTGSEGRENGSTWNAAVPGLLPYASVKEQDYANVISTRPEDLVSKEMVGQMQIEEKSACAVLLNDGANEPIVTQFTSTPKKRGRPRKTPVQVDFLKSRQVNSPTSSLRWSFVSKVDHNASEALVTYRRRGGPRQNVAGLSRNSQEENTDGQENSQNQTVGVTGSHIHERVVKNPWIPIPLFLSLSEEDQVETGVRVARKCSSHVVSVDVSRNSASPVLKEYPERKYARRHFRKSPGRPPKKIAQDEHQEPSTSASFSQSAARSVVLVDSETTSQPVWKDVHITGGKEIGTGSHISRSQLFGGSAVTVAVEEQGNQTLNHNHVQEISIESPGRSNGSSLFPRHDLDCASVPSFLGGNLQHDGHLIALDGTEAGNTGNKREFVETEKRLEARKRLDQGEVVGITPTDDSVKNGPLDEGGRFEHLTPIFITETTSMHDIESKPGTRELQEHMQAANEDLPGRKAGPVKIFDSNSESRSESRLQLALFDGVYQRKWSLCEEEAGINVQVENCDVSHIEEMQVECEEPEKQLLTACSTDVADREDEPKVEAEYPSWGDKLCSDSDDETETLLVCGDSVHYKDGTAKSVEVESLKSNFPQEVFSQPQLAVKMVLMKETTCSSIREVNVPANITSRADDMCIPGKVLGVVSDLACDHGEANGGLEVGTNQKPNKYEECVPIDLVCNICDFKDAEDQMLMCEEHSCTCAIHTFCLNPPLQRVPTDAWKCLHCVLMTTQNISVQVCSPKWFPPKKIQAVIGRRSNMVKDEQKQEHVRMEYLVKWDTLSHWHDTWIEAAWFVGERKKYATLFECKHPNLPKIDAIKEVDNTTVDERKPEWLLIDRVINCRERGVGQLHPSELSRVGYKREGVQFLVKWQSLDHRYATWEETKFSKDMREAISAFISRHGAAGVDDVSARPGDSVAASINRQPDYIHGGSMYGYQIQGLRWLLSNFEDRRNVILADEMGLGKTVQTIAFISCVRNEKLSRRPVLVVAPKSTLSEWAQELKHWAPGLNAVVYQGEKDNRDVIRRCEFYTSNGRPLFEVLLTSYELAIQDNRYLCKFCWAAIIVDEGHRMRNMRSKLGSVLKEHQAEFRLLLTGTPMQNTLAELSSLFRFLDPVEFPDPDNAAGEFTGAVIAGRADTAGLEAKSRQLSKLHELLKLRILRRVKIEVPVVNIPGKKVVEVPCALTPLQRHLYAAVLKENHKLLNQGVQSGLKRSLNNILTDLKMVCNHPYLFPEREPQGLKPEEASRMMVDVSGKLLFLEKLLPMLKEGGHRVLLFSQMTRMLDIIEEFLDFMGLSYIRIDGSTSAAERLKALADYNRPECTTFIFLSSTGAGGLGINLRSADTVIIYDPDFNLFVDLQVQARAHRLGQDKIVLVYQLVTQGSVEEKIVERSKKKFALENMVMTSGLKGPNQNKETASDISDVLLHGLGHIVDEHHVKAVCYEHTVESVQKLLDRSVSESSSDVNDNGYLGAVQGHKYIIQDAGKAIENHAHGRYGEQWRELLSRLVEQDEKEELGRGMRTRKHVEYSCVQNMECQEYDEYNPTRSDESSSDVSLEAEGSMPSSKSKKSTNLRLGLGQEGDVSKSQKLPGSSVHDTGVVGRHLPSFASSGAVPCTLQPAQTLPPPDGLLRPGSLGTSSLPLSRQAGIEGSSGLPGGTLHPSVTGTSGTSSGLVYERVISSQGIGIHLNRLIPPVRDNLSFQAPVPPGNTTAVFGYTGPSVGNKHVKIAVRGPTRGSNGAASGISWLLGAENSVQFAGAPSISGTRSAVIGATGCTECGYAALPRGDKSVHSGGPAPIRRTNSAVIERNGVVGGRNSLQPAGLAPCAGPQSVDFRYSVSPGGKSVQSELPGSLYVPPVPTPSVNIAVRANSVTPSGSQSAQLAHPPLHSCISSGRSSSISNIEGSFAGLLFLQNSSNMVTASTYSTRVSVPPKLISDTTATSPSPCTAVFQVPIPEQTIASTKPVRIGMKQSARNRLRVGMVPSGHQVVMNDAIPSALAADPVGPVDPVVSPSGNQAVGRGNSVPVSDQSAGHLNSSKLLLCVRASGRPESRLTDTVVSSLRAMPVIVAYHASQRDATTLTREEVAPCFPVGRVHEEVTEGSHTQISRETSVAVKDASSRGVALPPVVRAQAQRKPLWLPKGDAGLLMGPVRETC